MNQFDKNIRERFDNFQAEVPADMWERISGKKDDRKPGGWWNWKNVALFAGVLLILGIGGTIIYKHFNSSPNVAPSSDEINTVQNNTGLNKDGEKVSSKPESQGTTDDKIISADAGQNNRTDLYESEKSNPSLPNKKYSDGKSAQKNAVNAADRISNGKNYADPATKNRITKSNVSSIKSMISIDASVDAAQDQNDGIVGNRNKNKKHQYRKTKINIASAEPEEEVEPESVNEEYSGLTLKISTAELLKTSVDQQIKTEKHPALSFIPCPRAEKNAAGNKRYFEFYGGYDFALRSFEDTGNSNYLQKRKESLQQSSAFSAGLRYTKVFNNGMSIRTGLNYSQINEKFKYVDAHIIRTEYIINDNGDTIGSFLSSSSRYKITHNKYRSIDIPLLVGYEWGNGNFHFNLNAGPVINIYSWQKGDVLNSDLNPVSITTGKNNSAYGFRTNTGLGIMASLSAYYKINERLHFLAEPYFRYNFSQVNKFDITLKQKYNLAGLRLGLRYDF